MMTPSVVTKDLTHTFFEQRRRVTQRVDLRKRFIEAAFLNQAKNERDMIQSRIERMTFGCRKAFLASRLQHLEKELASNK